MALFYAAIKQDFIISIITTERKMAIKNDCNRTLIIQIVDYNQTFTNKQILTSNNP